MLSTLARRSSRQGESSREWQQSTADSGGCQARLLSDGLQRQQPVCITFKQGNLFERFNGTLPEVSSAFLEARGRSRTMEIEQRIEKWNARRVIVGGRIVCAVCSGSQALKDCDMRFSHARMCEAREDECKHPWSALHDILDCARG